MRPSRTVYAGGGKKKLEQSFSEHGPLRKLRRRVEWSTGTMT